jgi:hypothetical protein
MTPRPRLRGRHRNGRPADWSACPLSHLASNWCLIHPFMFAQANMDAKVFLRQVAAAADHLTQLRIGPPLRRQLSPPIASRLCAAWLLVPRDGIAVVPSPRESDIKTRNTANGFTSPEAACSYDAHGICLRQETEHSIEFVGPCYDTRTRLLSAGSRLQSKRLPHIGHFCRGLGHGWTPGVPTQESGWYGSVSCRQSFLPLCLG